MTDTNRRTVRTLLEGVVSVILWLGVALPVALSEAGVDATSVPGLAALLVILAVVTRLAQTAPIDKVLTAVDLGRAPKHRAGDPPLTPA